MTYPVLSYAAAHKWEPLAAKRGVSQVARSSRGFMRAYQRAGGWANLPEAWKRRRDAFVARHMAQVRQNREQLWQNGQPSRRALALIMWAYMPPRGSKTNPRKNPAIGPDMEGFRDLVEQTRTKPWFGPFGLKVGRRDWEGDLDLDIVSYKVKGKKVAAIACEVDVCENIIKEHNTYVVKQARGKGVMTSFYKTLLDHGWVIVSDHHNHSPAMRKVWMKLANMPGVTGYVAEGGVLEGGEEFKDEPFDSRKLDDILILVPWDDPSLAEAALERTMEMLDWDYGVDESCRPINA